MENENPGAQVEAAIEHCLEVAHSWLAWDGRPHVSEGGDRIYTPHKAVRRIADHLVDHLAEVEALLAGARTEPDLWHGSLVTTDADWARFTELDLDEAAQRLRRLGRTFALRLAAAGPEAWTFPAVRTGPCGRSPSTSAASAGYADQVGSLTR